MGVHPKVVQERLGHASIQITLDTYSFIHILYQVCNLQLQTCLDLFSKYIKNYFENPKVRRMLEIHQKTKKQQERHKAKLLLFFYV